MVPIFRNVGCNQRGLFVILALLLMSGVVVTGQPVQAATLSVCPSGCAYTTINAAIAAAAPGDTITIGPGDYTETLGINKDLTLQGAGSANTRVSYSQPGSIVIVAQNSAVSINNLTLRQGRYAVINYGQLTINQSVIEDHWGAAESTIRNYGWLFLMDSTVRNNVSGSGIILNAANAVATILRSTLYGNNGLRMIIYNQSHMQVANSTISDNLSTALFNENGYLSLANSTIVDNRRTIVSTTGDNAVTVLANNVLVGSPTADDCIYLGGNVISQGTNVASDNTCRLNHATDKTNVAPLLGPLQNNGGPTLTHALLSGSPALNTGNCSQPTDQRGIQRPQGASCDSGAFELVPRLPPQPTATPLPPTRALAPVSVTQASAASQDADSTNQATPLAGSTPEVLDNDISTTTALAVTTSGESAPVAGEGQAKQSQTLFLPLVMQ